MLLALTSSTLFVSGASGQEGRLQTGTATLRASTALATGVASSVGTNADGVRRPAAARYDVVVLMVEFQPDTTRFTTGDGTFGGTLYSSGLEPRIDPLPHDRGYVSAHMDFLADYVSRVSDGKTELVTHVLVNPVRVSGKMGDYSPTGLDANSDAELGKLAGLVSEAWALAAPAWPLGQPLLNPETTAFVIVHAGIGRDVELVGTILDKTPEDLPSLYFSPEALDRLDPGVRPTIASLPVNHGIIVPRTETRQGYNSLADEDFLAEFSVNGLLAASFFNFLGVPDLFDTATGQSAIGPFGLMDGLGIFAYAGLFPPEPTGWTKYFLGWSDPVEFISGQSVDLEYAGGAGGAGTSALARASISEAEYFLVENRHRDPEMDGAVLQVWDNGVITEMRFENGAAGFNSSSVSDFPGGVVVSIDNYDFALPGGKDEIDTDLIGGVLIWHVDERIIAANMASNTVNADKNRRGLDLEEADSAQDIGNPIGGFFGPSFDLGSPFDFFYLGNPVVTVTVSGNEIGLYQNRFGPDTHPSSDANDGGPGFLEIGNFSAPGIAMSVTLTRLSSAGIEVVREEQLNVPQGALSGHGLLRFVGANGVMAYSADSGLLRLTADGQEIASVGDLGEAEPAIAGNAIWAASNQGFLTISGSGAVSSLSAFPMGSVSRLTTPIITVGGPRGLLPMVGAMGNQGPIVLVGGGAGATVIPQESPVISLARPDANSVIVVLSDRADNDAAGRSWSYPTVDHTRTIRPQFGRDRRGVMGVVPDPGNASLRILLPDYTAVLVSMADYQGFDGMLSGKATLADLDNDGLLDVLIADGSHLWGIARSGAVTNGFPIPTRAAVTGAALVVESAVDADDITVIAMASDGQLDAYRSDTRLRIPGFPLSVGRSAGLAPTFNVNSFESPPVQFMAVSEDGYTITWGMENFGALRGADILGDVSNSSFVDTEPLTTTLLDTPRVLVPGQVYNWPNPVRDGVTRFRFLPTVTCSISIIILDAAGSLVDTLELETAPAEVPSEVVWTTDAESGLYFARIRARAVDGRTEDTLVKVAIIR
ncbi:MAG: hypothetical protein ACI80V_001764 [Rhodothermales bacterium]